MPRRRNFRRRTFRRKRFTPRRRRNSFRGRSSFGRRRSFRGRSSFTRKRSRRTGGTGQFTSVKCQLDSTLYTQDTNSYFNMLPYSDFIFALNSSNGSTTRDINAECKQLTNHLNMFQFYRIKSFHFEFETDNRMETASDVNGAVPSFSTPYKLWLAPRKDPNDVVDIINYQGFVTLPGLRKYTIPPVNKCAIKWRSFPFCVWEKPMIAVPTIGSQTFQEAYTRCRAGWISTNDVDVSHFTLWAAIENPSSDTVPLPPVLNINLRTTVVVQFKDWIGTSSVGNVVRQGEDPKLIPPSSISLVKSVRRSCITGKLVDPHESGDEKDPRSEPNTPRMDWDEDGEFETKEPETKAAPILLALRRSKRMKICAVHTDADASAAEPL
nr:MAG: capsid protein [Cressdnaviricota sp.]